METTYQASHMGSTFQKNAQSMLVGKRTNILLVKDDVGKAKPSTRKLPSEHMAFGKANRFDESAAQGTSHSYHPLPLSTFQETSLTVSFSIAFNLTKTLLISLASSSSF